VNTDIDFEDYLDAEIVDQNGRLVGVLACFWTDQDGQPAFLGIKTHWHPQRTAVVPINKGQVDERQSCVWIKLPETKIREAPGLDCDQQLDEGFENRLYDYFGMAPPLKRRRYRMNDSAVARHAHGYPPASPEGEPAKPPDRSGPKVGRNS